jgi:hypothetical protein
MSWLSEQAITHIWERHGDSNQYTPYREKPDNTTYVWSLRPYVRQQFTWWSKSPSRAHLSLMHFFHAIPLWAIRGRPIHYPGIHHYRNAGVLSDSATISATKFVRPHKSIIHQYRSILAHRDPDDAVPNRHMWGLPHLEIRTWKHTTLHPSHPVFFTFPYVTTLVSL